MRIALSVLCYLLIASAAHTCPPQGDSKVANLRVLDVMKNRNTAPLASEINHQIALDALLVRGDDTNRFKFTDSVKITGYVADVLPGGLESCNCHASDLQKRDTHIILVASSKDAKNRKRHVIVEVTPRFHGSLGSTKDLRSRLLGHTVTFTGWMLFDAEHKQNAFNTNPRGTNVWRATAWEIHPVSKIDILSGGLTTDERESVERADADIADLHAQTRHALRLIAMQSALHLIFHPWEALP